MARLCHFNGCTHSFLFFTRDSMSPIAGLWADKTSHRNMMLGTDLIAAFLTLGLYFSSSPIEALCLLFLRSSVVCFTVPAQQAYIKHVVSDEHLLKASSYTMIVSQMGKVAGPLTGALLLMFASARDCILLNTVSFLISASVLATLPRDRELLTNKTNDESPQHWRKEMLIGLKFLWRHSLLRMVTILVMVWFFL